MARTLLTGLLTALLVGCGGDSAGTASRAPLPAPSTAPPLLRLRVVDEAGAPLAGVRVLAANTLDGIDWPLDAPARAALEERVVDVRSGEDGAVRIEGLAPGAARLSLRSPGRAAREVTLRGLATGTPTELGDLRLETGCTLTGTVTASTGRPLAGARLHLLRPEDAPRRAHAWCGRPLGTTDERGRFRATDLEPGPFTLAIEAAGSAPFRVDGAVTDALDLGTLALREAARLAGIVEDFPLGDVSDLRIAALPAGAVPWLRRPGGTRGLEAQDLDGFATCPIAEDGSFSLEGLLPDELYCVRAIAAGDPLRVEDAWSAPLLVESGKSDVVLRVHPSVRIEVLVEDAESGTLLLDARHEWLGARSLPRRGVDHVRATTEGARARLRVDADGYASVVTEPLALVPTGPLEPVRVALQPVPRREVRVVRAEDGGPVPGARIDLESAGEVVERAETDARGIALLDHHPGAARTLVVAAPGHATRRVAFDGADVRLEPCGVLRVRVHDERERSVAGVVVRATTEDAQVTRVTDADGLAEFADLAPGEVRLEIALSGAAEDPWAPPSRLDALPGQERVPSPGFSSAGAPRPTVSVHVRAGERTDVELPAAAPVRVAGVLRESGLPLAGAVLRAFPARPREELLAAVDDARSTTRSGRDGAFDLGRLEPGSWVLAIDHASRAGTALRSFRVDAAPSELPIDLEVRTLRGRVVDGAERPVAGAGVYLPGLHRREARFGPADGAGDHSAVAWGEVHGTPRVAVTGADGSFVLRGLDGGAAVLVGARGPRVEDAAVGAERVAPDAEEVVVRLAHDSTLWVDGFTPKPLERALGLAWRHGRDFEHALRLELAGKSVVHGLSADAWTVFQAELDGWGEITGVRLLSPVALDPVGDSSVRVHR